MATIGDDGRVRTGTVWTATAHAVTAVIGSGVLAVPWSVAQIGWIFGPTAIVVFATITYINARLLSDCYRSPDPIKGQRNYTYLGAVKAILGKKDVIICAIAQCSLLWGTMVGYTITAATSMLSIKRTNCYHTNGPNADCQPSGNSFMLIFGAIQIILSQFPNLGNIAFLSVTAAIMSFGYSFIALYLCIAEFASHPQPKGTLTGVHVSEEDGITLSMKIWYCFQALGNIAFSYTYSQLLVEIQDTLKSPPSENKTMKRATLYSIGLTTAFYTSLGFMGYLAFGNKIAGNVLTAFHEPFWLVDLAHVGLIIHMTGAFQVFAQPIYALYENWLSSKYPNSSFFYKSYNIHLPYSSSGFLKPYSPMQFTLCRLLLRPLLVSFTILISMMFPFFNAVLGLLGSVAFWPLTVYLPITMYMTQANIKRGRFKWLMLQCLSMLSLIVSVVAGIGSVADIADRFKKAKLFSAAL